MDAAPTAYCLWQRFLRYDPQDPHWPNRDRFVLSSGHASMLLYSLLYLCGVKALNPSYEQAGGLEEVRLTKEFYGWNPDARFQVPDGVPEHFREQIGHCGAKFRAAWEKLFAAYRQQYPDLAGQIDRMQRRDLPAGWDSALRCFRQMRRAWRRATRDASGKVLNAIAEKMPWLPGGAADLAPSTKTHLSTSGSSPLTLSPQPGDKWCATLRRSETGMPGCGRYVFDHRAAALVMLVYSWLAMHSFSALRTPAYIQHCVCRGQFPQ